MTCRLPDNSMELIVLSAGGVVAPHLHASVARTAHGGVAADRDSGRDGRNAMVLWIEAGAGGQHPVAAAVHRERAAFSCIGQAVDAVGAVVGIVDVGQSKDGRDHKAGIESSAVGTGAGEIHLAAAALRGQRDRDVVNPAVLECEVRVGAEAESLE